MKIKLEQEVQPFQVPNFVIVVAKPRPKQEGFVEATKYALGDLADETLEMLCDQFRRDVFARAKQQRAGDEERS